MTAIPAQLFLPAGGTMAPLLQEFDWAGSAFGEPPTWPAHLRSAVDMLFDSSQPMRLAWGPHRSMLYNAAYSALLGKRHPAAFGQPMARVWPELWQQASPLLDRVFAGEGLHQNDVPYLTERNGYAERINVSYTYLPVRGPNGTVDGALCVCSETTAQVDAVREQAEQNERLHSMFNQAPSFMAVLRGVDHRFEFVNTAFQRLVGRNPLGMPMRDAFPDLAGQGFFDLLDEVFGGGEPFVGTAVPIVFDHTFGQQSPEERLLNFVYQPLRDRQGTVYGIFIEGHDVTAEHRATEAQRQLADSLEQRVEQRSRELAHTEAQLRQSQKMEAIGQLTGGIAHDFNNMLQGIVMPLQLIQRKAQTGDAAEIGRYVTAGLASAQRAAALTQRLLAFSRRQPLDSRPTDIAHALHDIQPMLGSTLGDGVLLQIDIQEELWNATTDLHQFENAVLNLAINARDAMPDGGLLDIVAENVNLTQKAVAGITGLEAGDYVRVVVRDTGVGMAEDILIKAFDPFFTTKPLGQGTGLGLSMIYGYARQSGGYVALDSEAGVGTVVRLYLPRSLAGEERTLEAAYPALDMPGKATTRYESVLVVEDDETVRELVVELLRAQGLQVMEASTGTEGMQLLSGALRFDLLLTDVGLPGANGRQLADFAQERLPGIRVVLMTGYAEQASMRSHFLGKTMQLLVKPFGTEQLLNKVRNALARPAGPVTPE